MRYFTTKTVNSLLANHHLHLPNPKFKVKYFGITYYFVILILPSRIPLIAFTCKQIVYRIAASFISSRRRHQRIVSVSVAVAVAVCVCSSPCAQA